jgi:hypothetical protein
MLSSLQKIHEASLSSSSDDEDTSTSFLFSPLEDLTFSLVAGLVGEFLFFDSLVLTVASFWDLCCRLNNFFFV